MTDFKPGGLGSIPDGPQDIRDVATPHPWKTEFIVPLNPTPDQVIEVATVMAFQAQIELLDTSWLDET
ncbi:hypothetical protein [Streptomyces flavidovirens]|uniref:hypothetical protein n=1 Tax=Streptomyces flavidovirens TaxID=67298 RepID=UPI0036B1341F